MTDQLSRRSVGVYTVIPSSTEFVGDTSLIEVQAISAGVKCYNSNSPDKLYETDVRFGR